MGSNKLLNFKVALTPIRNVFQRKNWERTEKKMYLRRKNYYMTPWEWNILRILSWKEKKIGEKKETQTCWPDILASSRPHARSRVIILFYRLVFRSHPAHIVAPIDVVVIRSVSKLGIVWAVLIGYQSSTQLKSVSPGALFLQTVYKIIVT